MKRRLYTLLVVALAIGSLLATSCKKQEGDYAVSPKAVTKAEQAYEQYKSTLAATKSAGAQGVVKPMPGDFTPLWDRAIERQDGDMTITTVPISASVTYKAVYSCNGHDSSQEHSHDAINVVQKLAIVIQPQKTSCYIINIVPYEDCALSKDAIEEGFVYGGGMAGFSGFVACHDMTGKTTMIDQYIDGLIDNSIQPSDPNIASVTRGVFIYQEQNTPQRMSRAVQPHPMCDYCFSRCDHPYDAHSTGFTSVDEYRDNLRKLSMHCGIGSGQCGENNGCREVKNSTKCICSHGGSGSGTPPCKWCGKNCGGSCASGSNPCAFCGVHGCLNAFEYVHCDLLFEYFRHKISSTDLHNIQAYCYQADNSTYQTAEYMYMHNITLYANREQSMNYLNSYFINYIKLYKQGRVETLGSALHPVLDAFVPMNTRKDELNFYTYEPLQNVISSPDFYMYSKETVLNSIYNSVLKLPSNPTDSQILQILEQFYGPLT